MLRIILLTTLFILFTTTSVIATVIPQDIQECKVIDGITYCPTQQEVIVGTKKIVIKDPQSLFEAAIEQQFNKLNLWTVYDYPPFIKELAKQNDMEPQELIDILADQDIPNNPWEALKQLQEVYVEVKTIYGSTIDKYLEFLINKIIDDIMVQIKQSV